MFSDPSWYKASGDQTSLDPAKDAYDEAIEIFTTSLSKDPKKHAIASQAASMNDVVEAVVKAQERYKSSRHAEGTRKWLSDFSQRIHFYGGIMDVMVQHHPEYVSLAWGAMKFLFVGVVNHENMVVSLARCLCEISDVLPRIQFASILYPTAQMIHAVAELYAYIIRLLIRAQQWYEENKLKHLVHSITRPDEIRNADLKLMIQQCTRNVEALAAAGSQAELRDMHNDVQTVMKNQLSLMENQLSLMENQRTFAMSMDDIRKLIISYHQLNANARINTTSRVDEIQCANLLAYLATLGRHDFMQNWQKSVQLRNWRRSRHLPAMDTFWTNQAFVKWNLAPTSALLLLRFPLRFAGLVQDLFVDAIQHLRDSNIPVLWLLKTEISAEGFQLADIVRSLTLQALHLNANTRTEAQLSQTRRQFQSASTEDELLALLGSVLEMMPRIYIFINLDCLEQGQGNQLSSSSLDEVCSRLIVRISVHSPRTILKIVLLTAKPIDRERSKQGAFRYVVTVANSAKINTRKLRQNARDDRYSRGKGTRVSKLFS